VALQPPFYNRVGSFLLIPLLVLMGIVPFLAWSKTHLEKFLWKILVPWFAALGVGFLVVWFVRSQAAAGFKAATPAVLVVTVATLGAFAAFSNLILAWKVLRAKAVTMGGWLAHVGIGLLFLGTVITNVYEDTDNVVLVEGSGPRATRFGYALQFEEWTHDAKMRQAQESGDPQILARVSDEIQRQDWFDFGHGVRLRMIPLRDPKGVARADEVPHDHDGDGKPDHADGEAHDASGLAAKGAEVADPHAGLDPHAMLNPHRAPNSGLDESLLDRKASFTALAPVFKSVNLMVGAEEGKPTTMRWPYIHKDLARDFYVMVTIDPFLVRPKATVREGQTVPVVIENWDNFVLDKDGYRVEVMPTGYRVRYRKFYMRGGGGVDGSVMGMEGELIGPDGKAYPIRPGTRLGGHSGGTPINMEIPGMGGVVVVEKGPDPSTKEVSLNFELPQLPARWVVPLQVTNKPGINLVWLGVVVMGAGILFALLRRSLEARRSLVFATTVAAGAAEEAVQVPVPPVTAGPGGAGPQQRARPSRGRQKARGAARG